MHGDIAAPRLYKLFYRIAATDKLVEGLKAYTTLSGKTIVSDTNRDKFMIEDLLALKHKLDTVVHGPFEAAPDFVDSIRTTFQVGVLSFTLTLTLTVMGVSS